MNRAGDSKGGEQVKVGSLSDVPQGAVDMSQVIVDFCVEQGWLKKEADSSISVEMRSRFPFSDDILKGMQAVPGYKCLWANRDINGMDPYSRPSAYIDELLSHHDQGNYIVFGMAGHGVQSWCLHIFVVEKDLAYFAQIPWGNLSQRIGHGGEKSAASVVQIAFASLNSVRRLLQEAHEKGKFEHGERLVVVDIQHGNARKECAIVGNNTIAKDIKWEKTNAIFRTPFAVAQKMVHEIK